MQYCDVLLVRVRVCIFGWCVYSLLAYLLCFALFCFAWLGLALLCLLACSLSKCGRSASGWKPTGVANSLQIRHSWFQTFIWVLGFFWGPPQYSGCPLGFPLNQTRYPQQKGQTELSSEARSRVGGGMATNPCQACPQPLRLKVILAAADVFRVKSNQGRHSAKFFLARCQCQKDSRGYDECVTDPVLLRCHVRAPRFSANHFFQAGPMVFLPPG